MTPNPTHLIIASIASLGCAMTVQAAETSWQLDEEAGASLIFAQDVGGPSLSLVCSDSIGIQAILYLNGTDSGTPPINPRTRLKSRNMEMSTDSYTQRDAKWGYWRPQKVLVSTKSWQGKRLFNAAIKGEAVAIDISRVGEYTLTLPPMNADFAEFASSCAATNPSK